jgi:ferritin
MLSTTILSALNAQIAQEKFGAMVYQQMACWCLNRGLRGFYGYLDNQAKDECEHAHKFIDYILRQRGQVALAGTDDPKQMWGSCVEAFEDILALEKQVTALINNLMKLVNAEGDFATQSMLQWFVDNQVQEEFEINCILQKLQMIGDDKAALLELDEELGEQSSGDTIKLNFGE